MDRIHPAGGKGKPKKSAVRLEYENGIAWLRLWYLPEEIQIYLFVMALPVRDRL